VSTSDREVHTGGPTVAPLNGPQGKGEMMRESNRVDPPLSNGRHWLRRSGDVVP